MIVNLEFQVKLGPALPAMPVSTVTGGALPLELRGIPAYLAGNEVTGVNVTVTNAQGVPATAPARRVGGAWHVLFAASNFTAWGDVAKGVRIHATVAHADGTSSEITVAMADLAIVPADASAVHGGGDAGYVAKGSDIYLKSQVVDGVQHYVKQVMAYDADIGWGAMWTGDYILSAEGEFVLVESGE